MGREGRCVHALPPRPLCRRRTGFALGGHGCFSARGERTASGVAKAGELGLGLARTGRGRLDTHLSGRAGAGDRAQRPGAACEGKARGEQVRAHLWFAGDFRVTNFVLRSMNRRRVKSAAQRAPRFVSVKRAESAAHSQHARHAEHGRAVERLRRDGDVHEPGRRRFAACQARGQSESRLLWILPPRSVNAASASANTPAYSGAPLPVTLLPARERLPP